MKYKRELLMKFLSDIQLNIQRVSLDKYMTLSRKPLEFGELKHYEANSIKTNICIKCSIKKYSSQSMNKSIKPLGIRAITQINNQLRP